MKRQVTRKEGGMNNEKVDCEHEWECFITPYGEPYRVCKKCHITMRNEMGVYGSRTERSEGMNEKIINRIRLDETEAERNEPFDEKNSEYAEFLEGDLLYIHQGFFASILFTKEQALMLHKFISDSYLTPVNGKE